MVWDELIACYLFLAGMGAGSLVFSVLVGWKKPEARKLPTIGMAVAFAAVAAGTLLLAVDAKAGLHDIVRFAYLVSNLGSVMAWGVIILSAFLLVALASAVWLWRKGPLPKALGIAGIVLALCTAAYTGVLLGASPAYPLWNPVVLPLLFVVSALSTGFACTGLLGHFLARDEAEGLAFPRAAGRILPLLEAALIAVLLALTAATGGSGAAAAAATVAALTAGPFALAFWGLLVAVGLAFPCVVEWCVRAGKAPSKLVAASEAGVLVGGFVLRYLVVMAAVSIAFA